MSVGFFSVGTIETRENRIHFAVQFSEAGRGGGYCGSPRTNFGSFSAGGRIYGMDVLFSLSQSHCSNRVEISYSLKTLQHSQILPIHCAYTIPDPLVAPIPAPLFTQKSNLETIVYKCSNYFARSLRRVDRAYTHFVICSI